MHLRCDSSIYLRMLCFPKYDRSVLVPVRAAACFARLQTFPALCPHSAWKLYLTYGKGGRGCHPRKPLKHHDELAGMIVPTFLGFCTSSLLALGSVTQQRKKQDLKKAVTSFRHESTGGKGRTGGFYCLCMPSTSLCIRRSAGI
jgi:hypothetical protein